MTKPNKCRFFNFSVCKKYVPTQIFLRRDVSFLASGRSNYFVTTFFPLWMRSIGFLEEVEKLLPPLPIIPSQLLKSKEKKERVKHGK